VSHFFNFPLLVTLHYCDTPLASLCIMELGCPAMA